MQGYWLIWWLGVICLAVIIVLVIKPGRTGTKSTGSSAIDILNERYARGEISREEFLERKKDILG
jgi:putative membrane protein